MDVDLAVESYDIYLYLNGVILELSLSLVFISFIIEHFKSRGNFKRSIIYCYFIYSLFKRYIFFNTYPIFNPQALAAQRHYITVDLKDAAKCS